LSLFRTLFNFSKTKFVKRDNKSNSLNIQVISTKIDFKSEPEVNRKKKQETGSGPEVVHKPEKTRKFSKFFSSPSFLAPNDDTINLAVGRDRPG